MNMRTGWKRTMLMSRPFLKCDMAKYILIYLSICFAKNSSRKIVFLFCDIIIIIGVDYKYKIKKASNHI